MKDVQNGRIGQRDFKRRHALAAVGMLLATLPLSAVAQPATPPAQEGSLHSDRMERGAERMAERNALLRERLNLRPNQQAAWTAYTAAMAPHARRPEQRPDRAAFQNMTTPQRLDHMAQFRAERMREEERREGAIRTFYNALDAQQRTVFDAQFRGDGHGGPGHHRGRHHEGHDDRGGERR